MPRLHVSAHCGGCTRCGARGKRLGKLHDRVDRRHHCLYLGVRYYPQLPMAMTRIVLAGLLVSAVALAKRLIYLEKACLAHHKESCGERGQAAGRSKSAGVKWYAEGCKQGERYACNGLPMTVLAAFVLDPVPGGAMDGKALLALLEP